MQHNTLKHLQQLKDELEERGFKIHTRLTDLSDMQSLGNSTFMSRVMGGVKRDLWYLRDVKGFENIEGQISDLEERGFKLFDERKDGDPPSEQYLQITKKKKELEKELCLKKITKLKLEAAQISKRLKKLDKQIKAEMIKERGGASAASAEGAEKTEFMNITLRF